MKSILKATIISALTLTAMTSYGYEWMLKSGKTVEADFVKMSGNNVVLKNKEGKTKAVPLNQFTKEDQEHAKGLHDLAALKQGNAAPAPKKQPHASSPTAGKAGSATDPAAIMAQMVAKRDAEAAAKKNRLAEARAKFSKEKEARAAKAKKKKSSKGKKKKK